MRTKQIFLTLLRGAACPVWDRPQTDTLIMKKGARFTCEIKRLEL